MPPKKDASKKIVGRMTLPRPVVKRMLYAAGGYRMASEVCDEINQYIQEEIDSYIKYTSTIAEYNGAKTLKVDYLAMALQHESSRQY